MPVIVIVGAQFGDEAKGKITDYLAANAEFVVRTGGGPNAGHTIDLPEGKVVLHQLPCGVLRHGVTAVCGPGMVLDPTALDQEIRTLEERRMFKGTLIISERAHAILPTHIAEDAWEEKLRTATHPGAELGTTMRGIGPAYADRYGRWGVRFGELIRPAKLRQRLELLLASKPHLAGILDVNQLQSDLGEVAARLAPFVQPTEPTLWSALARKETVLLEGAQSALLDIDFGTYPYVTSHHPTSAGALVGSGIPPFEVSEVVGVTKAYATRVGAGPFPTEVGGDLGAYLQREGGERGATTGRVRQVGWLDLVLLRYVTKLNGFTSLALTKVDVLGGLDDVPVAVQYVTPEGQTLTDYPPADADDLAHVTPVYEMLPSWPKFNERLVARLRDEGAAALPPTLKRFVAYIGQETGVPVEWVSYGPRREETVWLGKTHGSPAAGSVTAWAQ
ncbi:MAG: adenylosuccinate synthase [Thermoplasmata archaeon]|nr:adenylosuccinate synthase [Thermoplasmata archaeon]